jgi:hypothetical protein
MSTLPTSQSRPGTVAGDEFEHGPAVAFIDGDGDLRRRAEHARLARHATRDGDRRFVGMLQRSPQRAFDLADAFAVADRRAVFLEHVVEVEAEAVARRGDSVHPRC